MENPELNKEENLAENSEEKKLVQTSYSPTVPDHLPNDLFSKGRVVKFFPQSHYGFIKDKWGKDIYFNLDELRFVGDRGRESLREGCWVGYDVGWTSHGLHVSKMKVY